MPLGGHGPLQPRPRTFFFYIFLHLVNSLKSHGNRIDTPISPSLKRLETPKPNFKPINILMWWLGITIKIYNACRFFLKYGYLISAQLTYIITIIMYFNICQKHVTILTSSVVNNNAFIFLLTMYLTFFWEGIWDNRVCFVSKCLCDARHEKLLDLRWQFFLFKSWRNFLGLARVFFFLIGLKFHTIKRIF